MKAQNYDLSNNQTTSDIIAWLDSGIIRILKEETEKPQMSYYTQAGNSTNELNSFIGGYTILMVKESKILNAKYSSVKVDTGIAKMFFMAKPCILKEVIILGYKDLLLS